MNKENKTKDNIVAIDVMKFLCAILVVCSHSSPFSFINERFDMYVINLSFRYAVPFFFVCSGYFYFRKENRNIMDFVKRILKLYLLWTVIYILFSMPYVINKWSIKSFFLSGSFNHFWYFPSLILGTVLIDFLLKKFKFPVVAVISIGLYALGMLGDSYFAISAHLPMIPKVLNIYNRLFDVTRNGFLFSAIFVLMGAYLARSNKEYNKKYYLIGLITFYLLFVLEFRVIVKYNLMLDKNLYIFIVPMVFFLFLFLKNLQLPEGKWGTFLRKMSTSIYCCHILIQTQFLLFLSKYSIQLNSLEICIVVIILSVLLSAIIVLASKKVKVLKYLY